MVSWVLCSWLPDDDQVWIDEPVSGKHRTALMIAAKKNRLQCLTALVEEFGARVNYQVRYFPPPPYTCARWLMHWLWAPQRSPNALDVFMRFSLACLSG